MKNVRIMIDDLIRACRALGEVHVVAAGSLYATLEIDETDRIALSSVGISWTFD
ncbi:hypothetical protein P106B_43 [Rhizobium phage vB_RglS_P106B]|uniref:Uncharacterized protein n=1 Tax=Rhizobium phage vB_RglS_P106B TaxID=1458697 RepID=W6EKG8_9CAUD|nr:hypothetical protein P106B_43 [Rhizobium phage vB_RglS_P106B]AHJ10726.1 hypothetical protein P106B_43 [Rhizobium phage vB_RglS_P106B]